MNTWIHLPGSGFIDSLTHINITGRPQQGKCDIMSLRRGNCFTCFSRTQSVYRAG